MQKITKVSARQILDSRGMPTVEVDVFVGKCLGRAGVPSGASTGSREAAELRDGNKRYRGKGVCKAVKNVNRVMAPKLVGMDASDQEGIDKLLNGLDGTKNKSKLGANAILGCSVACAKAAAESSGMSVHKYLNPKAKLLPVPFMNVINGGAHAGNDLDFQEILIAPIGAESFCEATQICSEVYYALKEVILKKYGKNAVNVGDEGGYAPPLQRTEEALELVAKAIENEGYTEKVKLALDAAANEFHSKGVYLVAGEKHDCGTLLDYYKGLVSSFPIVSIEDPFAENDWEGFTHITKDMDIQIIGDDLFATNEKLLERGVERGACNCMLLKVNQIGTLSEATEAAKTAFRNKYSVMVSHRSGETSDPFISDLAFCLECGQIKAGAPARGERTSKYNQLLRIEEEIGESGKYAGKNFREVPKV